MKIIPASVFKGIMEQRFFPFLTMAKRFTFFSHASQTEAGITIITVVFLLAVSV